MVDMIARLLGHILAIQQIHNTKQYTRNRQQGKEIDFSPRIKEDRGKQNGRNRS